MSIFDSLLDVAVAILVLAGVLIVLLAGLYVVVFVAHRAVIAAARRRGAQLENILGGFFFCCWLACVFCFLWFAHVFPTLPSVADAEHLYPVRDHAVVRYYTWEQYLLSPHVLLPISAGFGLLSGILLTWVQQAAKPGYVPPRFGDMQGLLRRR